MKCFIFLIGVAIIWTPLIICVVKIIDAYIWSNKREKERKKEERFNKRLKDDGFTLWNEL